ncbi:hypothetical protein [Methylobacterium sp. 285MFTsu5.1]|uniref:hypothetical protein n=1 Tax=Methylobacterium sp. 285MFTsu5.1 TaxID=1172187 RepID=UPI001319F977|nr:hypothetical protein [Methylobacterium sp. 285MFTsu5.1]
MPCVYCHRPGPFSDEHVLTRAFSGGGEDWVLVDTVCDPCNKLFRTYERAWTSAPGEAVARIAFGPAGRNRGGQAYQAHPSEHIYFVAPDDPVSYEVDILRGIEPRFRPQIALSGAGFTQRASTMEDVGRFKTALDAFLPRREITLQKRRFPGEARFRVAILSDADTFAVERIEMRRQPVDAWLDRFPNNMAVARDPRVSVDAHGRLRIRATGLKQVSQFFAALIAQGRIEEPGGIHRGGEYRLAIRSPYDVGKVHRAIAKTAVNFAVATRGADWISAEVFRPVLDYCLGRRDASDNGPFVGSLDGPTGIREIDAAVPEVHVLALTSNGARVIGLVRLYSGPTYRVHLGPAPTGAQPFTEVTWIDYNGPGRVAPFTYPPQIVFPGSAVAAD